MKYRTKITIIFIVSLIYGLTVLYIRNYYENISGVTKSDWNRLYVGGDASNFYDRAVAIANFEPYHSGYEYNVRVAYYRPPVYPAFMAISFLIFGKSFKPIILLQILLMSISVICIVHISKFFFEENVSFTAGILAILYYPFWNGAMTINSELFSMFLFIYSTLALISFLRSPERNSFKLVLSGLLSGLAVMTRGQFLFFAPLILVFLHFSISERKLRYYVIWFVAFLTPVLFWTIYSYLVSGIIVLVSTQGAFSMWWGWSKAVVIEQGYPIWNNAWDSTKTPVDQIGEYMLTKDNSWYFSEVFKFIISYPKESFIIAIYKILGAWGIEFFSKNNTIYYFIIRFFKINWNFLLAIPAIILLINKKINKKLIYFIISGSIAYTAVSLITAALYRYRYPFLDPFFIILSGYFVIFLYDKLAKRIRT